MDDRLPAGDHHDSDTTKPKSPKKSTGRSSDTERPSGSRACGNANRACGTSEETRRGVTRQKSKSRRSTETRPNEVLDDAEPIVVHYISMRAAMDEHNMAEMNAESSEALNSLSRAVGSLLERQSNSTRRQNSDATFEATNEEESDGAGTYDKWPTERSSVANPELIRTIASELASLGDKVCLHEHFRVPFEKTYELLEERAALPSASGTNVSLLNVFGDAVRRILQNQPLTWATLVTLLEFGYYVIRQLISKLVAASKAAMDGLVSQVRELVSAVVGYIRSAESGIVDFLVGEGGWLAVLDLNYGEANASSASLETGWYVTLGAFLLLGAASILGWPGAPK